MSTDSSASPGLRLPGLLHYREGSIPLTVALSRATPVRRMLPWSTCGDTQGLVRITPAKQYRLQLHVTTNDQLTDRRRKRALGSESSVRKIRRIETETLGGGSVRRMICRYILSIQYSGR